MANPRVPKRVNRTPPPETPALQSKVSTRTSLNVSSRDESNSVSRASQTQVQTSGRRRTTPTQPMTVPPRVSTQPARQEGIRGRSVSQPAQTTGISSSSQKPVPRVERLQGRTVTTPQAVPQSQTRSVSAVSQIAGLGGRAPVAPVTINPFGGRNQATPTQTQYNPKEYPHRPFEIPSGITRRSDLR